MPAEPKPVHPYRPVRGSNPLLPRPDYDVPDDAHACGINSLVERDGYWVAKDVHPAEGRYDDLS
jgi:hypothetical protein